MCRFVGLAETHLYTLKCSDIMFPRVVEECD